ncbi:MAG: HAMP domain-containing protein, partial [Chloroflexi bacterium]|nr:HAMP domain-containing protein [Chloroflexota bacterium]
MKAILFRPAIGLMNRLTYSHKMLAVAAVFVLALAMPIYQTVAALNADIDFTGEEVKGAEYLPPTLALLQHIQQHRGASAAFLGGDESFADVVTQKQALIEEDLRAVDAMDEKYGAEFGSRERWEALKTKWRGLQSDVKSLSADESFTRHTDLIEEILDFRVLIADASSLTLDPENDTFYLMIMVVSDYPAATEYLGQARAFGTAALGNGTIREQAAALEFMLRSSQNATRQAGEKVTKALAFNPSVRAGMERQLQEAETRQRAFLEMLEKDVINAETVTITPTEYFDAATQAIDAEFELVRALDAELDRLLAARGQRLSTSRNVVLGVVTVLTALAAWLFVGFYLAANDGLEQVKRAAAGIAEGDLNQTLEVNSQDEIGQLADAFRRMTAYLQNMAGVADKIAGGDLTGNVTLKSERDVLGNAFAQMTAYLQNVAGVADKIAGGDLTGNVTLKSERDVLGNAFAQMIANLRRAVGEVSQNASGVQSASGQLASAAAQAGQGTSQIATTIQQVARGTSQQTEGVIRTASSVEQMKRAIEGVAKGAQEQAAAVGKASNVTTQITSAIQQVQIIVQSDAQGSAQAAQEARGGAQKVAETIKGMESIKAKVGLSAAKVKEMGRRSDQIGAIVETIDDIASQT